MSEILKGIKSKSKSSSICEYCEKKFSSSCNLAEHRRVHTGERPFSCNLCHYSATRKKQLHDHIRSDLKEKPFKCPEAGSACNYSASTAEDVTRHHKTVHLGEKRFQCPIFGCGHKSVQKHKLTRHMKTHQDNPEKAFKCELCPFKTIDPSSIKRHMQSVHSTSRNFKCPKAEEGCEFAGKTKTNLIQHLESHLKKALPCPHPNCEYKTHNRSCLKNHMNIHSSDSASEKKFKCRICDYSSHQSCNLTVHMRNHTKETPYKCKYNGCQYQTKDSSNLNKHVAAVHEKIRPFKCPFSDSGCSYAAAQKSHLKNHQKTQHSQVANG